jgi:hypothetical protein
MRFFFILTTVLVLGLLLLLAGPPPSGAEDQPKFRDEMEERLGSADSRLLDLQMARFRAMFAENKDDKEIERIEKEFKDLQKECRDLLRATGKIP